MFRFAFVCTVGKVSDSNSCRTDYNKGLARRSSRQAQQPNLGAFVQVTESGGAHCGSPIANHRKTVHIIGKPWKISGEPTEDCRQYWNTVENRYIKQNRILWKLMVSRGFQYYRLFSPVPTWPPTHPRPPSVPKLRFPPPPPPLTPFRSKTKQNYVCLNPRFSTVSSIVSSSPTVLRLFSTGSDSRLPLPPLLPSIKVGGLGEQSKTNRQISWANNPKRTGKFGAGRTTPKKQTCCFRCSTAEEGYELSGFSGFARESDHSPIDTPDLLSRTDMLLRSDERALVRIVGWSR